MAASPPYRPAPPPRQSSADTRRVARWMLGLVAIIVLAGAFGSLQVFQVTSEGTAHDALRRATAALTEIDALLARHEGALRTAADSAAPGETLELEDYPIALALTPDEVRASSHEQLRALILDRSAGRLYEDGTGALREAAEGRGDIGAFSVAGATDRGLGALTSDNHMIFGILSAVLFVVAAALAGVVAATCQGWGRLGAAGVILAAAGAITLAVGGAVYLYARSSASGEDDFARAELFAILRDLSVAPVRNGVAALAAGAIIIIVALIAGALARTSAPATIRDVG